MNESSRVRSFSAPGSTPPISEPEAGTATAVFTLGELIGAILRHKLLVALLTILGGAGAFLVAKQLPVHYSADAALIADAGLSGIVDVGRGEVAPMIDPAATPTIVETAGSTLIIGRALAALPPEIRDGLLTASGIRESIAKAPDPARAAEQEAPLLTQYVSENLQITNSGRSYVVYVSYQASDPETAATIANAVTGAYLDYRAELKRNSYTSMLDSLESEIATLKDGLQAAERTAQTMREQGRLLAARSEALTGRQQDEAIVENSHLYARQREAEREAEATAAVYERLLLNQREIKSRLTSPELDVQLFAPAETPLTPSGFNVKPVLLVLGLGFGFCLGASLALLRERWRRQP